MSAEDFMRQFCPHLSDEEIEQHLAAARRRRDEEEARWERRQWRRVGARVGGVPRLSRMRTAYRAKARHR